MGCYLHNPYCGKCRPPLPMPRPCSVCKTLCEDITLTHCAECGAELAPYVPPVPRYCNRQQELCANPCGKAEAVSLSHNPCPLHTRVVEG